LPGPEFDGGSGALVPVGNWTLSSHRDVAVIGEVSGEARIPLEVSSSFTAWAT
jgi:hypothetical protein